MARKLVEAGVQFVNVTWDCYWERLKLQYECWDTHKRNCGVLRDYNLPQLDLTYSALMQDLQDRGLLDDFPLSKAFDLRLQRGEVFQHRGGVDRRSPKEGCIDGYRCRWLCWWRQTRYPLRHVDRPTWKLSGV